MARINISVPDDLKERMDKHPGINWSQTASESFKLKLNEIESTIEVKNMTDAIARLKASKAKYEDEVKTQGHQDGIEWAMQYAEYEELKRLFIEFDQYGLGSICSVEGFIKTITGDDSYICHDPEGEWIEKAYGELPIDTSYSPFSVEYIGAFVSGALEVYEQIEKI